MNRPTPDKFSAWFRRLVPFRLVRRFVQQQEGSAAIEFSLVAVPFLGLTFAILETALVFFAGQTLETAVTDSARLIMTGQAQDKAWTKDDFKTEVCSRIHGLFDCTGGVYVDVKTFDSFASINNDLPVTDGKIDESKLNFSPGAPGQIEVVTLYYQWPVYVSLLGNNLANINANRRLLVATAVFCNEPFSTATPANSCH